MHCCCIGELTLALAVFPLLHNRTRILRLRWSTPVALRRVARHSSSSRVSARVMVCLGLSRQPLALQRARPATGSRHTSLPSRWRSTLGRPLQRWLRRMICWTISRTVSWCVSKRASFRVTTLMMVVSDESFKILRQVHACHGLADTPEQFLQSSSLFTQMDQQETRSVRYDTMRPCTSSTENTSKYNLYIENSGPLFGSTVVGCLFSAYNMRLTDRTPPLRSIWTASMGPQLLASEWSVAHSFSLLIGYKRNQTLRCSENADEPNL